MSEDTTKPAKSLIQRIAEACNAVGGVEKKGRNEFHRYNYVKAADVAKAIRHELFQRSILLLADEKEIIERPIQTNGGGTMNYLRLKVEYTLLDGLSPEKVVTIAYGDAMDSGDKAIYKAKTGALKYFLRGLGLIPDEKDDPELDETVDESTDDAPPQATPPNGRRKHRGNSPTKQEYNVRAFASACNQGGKTAEQQAQYLQTKFSTTTVADLPSDEFQAAIRWALGNPAELMEGLEVSIAAVQAKKPQKELAYIVEPSRGVAGD